MTETIAEQKQHHNAKKRIWFVFWLLAVVTTIEVLLGIYKPDVLRHNHILNMEILNWIFIFLTVIKAYYITWAFMHMEHEKPSLRRTVVWTAVFYIAYIIFIFLTEGDYIHEVLKHGFVAWDF